MSSNSYVSAVTVAPSDTVDGGGNALYVGGAGNVSLVTGDNRVVIFAALAGATLPVAFKRINSTGTTATGLIALVG